jgi:iron uptake system component EfeO
MPRIDRHAIAGLRRRATSQARVTSPGAATAVVALAFAFAACSGNATLTGAATAVPSGVVAVQAKEYAFTPTAISVPSGSVTFSVSNAGSEVHEFEVFQGDKVVDEIEGIVPGLTKTATMTLAAGDYTFMCKLNGHDQLGMKGTITITGS